MGTREVYEEKLRRGNLDYDPTTEPDVGSARCPRCLSPLNPIQGKSNWELDPALLFFSRLFAFKLMPSCKNSSSGNKITGTIPSCMNNFTLLSSEADPDSWNEMPTGNYNGSSYDGASVTWKGKEATYNKHLRLLKMIDLSSNELFGEIPHELTSLIGLVGLNLSGNSLVGLIPQGIVQMRFLNFLDLSRNNLSGGIPSTLSKLSHLGVLDLSFNNLSGRIPWDTHMQTFGASTYLGNSRSCGPPLLSRPCPGDDQKPTDGSSDDSENSEKFINTGFYISLLLGFVVAFWVVFWSLYFNKWWNVRICITVADWLYVKVLVNKRRLMMRFLGNGS